MEEQKIVTKPAVTETVRGIAPGRSATFRAEELASYASAASVVSKLNKEAGRKAWALDTADNGVTYTITREPCTD